VLLLILESLGSTELLLILVMALVFFGPRKLPQISRSLGKSLADFRRASDDFKRTWEREVAMEENPRDIVNREISGFLDDSPPNVNEPPLETLPDELSVPREKRTIMAESDPNRSEVETVEASEPSQKRDWL
jgi:sec-independent protein translocase protein TatB